MQEYMLYAGKPNMICLRYLLGRLTSILNHMYAVRSKLL